MQLPSTPITVTGLMSGTSGDGIDLATVHFTPEPQWSYRILAARTYPYPAELEARLKTLPQAESEAVFETDAALGRFYGELILQFIEETSHRPALIASHGHTLFHRPGRDFTTQIGSGAHIAAVTGIDTVCDFRSKDVALRGQGAPLVPVGDKLLFSEYYACLNLGGIANISFDDVDGKRRAFDICPVNLALNELAAREGKPYDAEGKMAASGQLLPGLLEQFQQISFYRQHGARSLGREWVESEFLPLLKGAQNADLSHTVCEHIALQHAVVLRDTDASHKVLVTGGGAWNSYLVSRIQAHSKAALVVPDAELVNFKEALIFAFLGALNVMGRVNVFYSATGGLKDHVGGAFYRGN